MNSQSLYDLSPALHVMLMGIAVAIGPLSWMWSRHLKGDAARKLQALTLLTLFLAFDLVVFGAFTRLTDSGLGCPDWPGCYGNASPVGAVDQISQAQAQMPTGPVTSGAAAPRSAPGGRRSRLYGSACKARSARGRSR
jgi:heme a synthase